MHGYKWLINCTRTRIRDSRGGRWCRRAAPQTGQRIAELLLLRARVLLPRSRSRSVKRARTVGTPFTGHGTPALPLHCMQVDAEIRHEKRSRTCRIVAISLERSLDSAIYFSARSAAAASSSSLLLGLRSGVAVAVLTVCAAEAVRTGACGINRPF